MSEELSVDSSISEVFNFLKRGFEKAKKSAAVCAKKDAPILGKNEKELRRLYADLFSGICTEEMFKQCEEMPAENRWKLVEPFTQPLTLQYRDGSVETLDLSKPKSKNKKA